MKSLIADPMISVPILFFLNFVLNCESHVQIAGFVALDSLPMNDTNIFHVTITRPKD